MALKLPVYLDHHSTTPVDPRVLETMLPWFSERFGNTASRTHAFGWQALEATEHARKQVGSLVGCAANEVIFTSGATESNNLAILGIARASANRRHIVTGLTEHSSILDPCRHLEQCGYHVTYLPVNSEGLIDVDEFARAMTPDTCLASVMFANNEIGVLQPIDELAQIATERGVPLHVDAAQSAGKLPVDVRKMGIALLSISAHKMYGPKGVGALYIRRRAPYLKLEPILFGGAHEQGYRSGTLNTPGIVGLGRCCEIAAQDMDTEAERTRALRDRLLDLLLAGLDGIRVNGSMERRLPNNLNLSFDQVEGESLIMSMRDIAVSSGSACASASQEPSHVLSAIGLSPRMAHSSIRFGLGRFTTAEEIDYAAGRIIESVRRLREMSPGVSLA